MTPTGPRDVAERVSYDPDSQGQSSRKFAARVVESDGEHTVVSVDRPFPPGRPFVHDGAVYELNADVVDAVPATTFRLSFAETGDGDDVAAESIAYADLPRVDRSALSEIGFDDGPHFDLREYPVTYWDRRIEDSALVLDPVWPAIEWDERQARLSVERRTDRELRTYRYTARRLYDSPRTFGRALVAEHTLRLAGLSSAQERTVEAPVEDEYVVERRGPDDGVRPTGRAVRRRDDGTGTGRTAPRQRLGGLSGSLRR
jgi:hypothetical protein